MSTSILDDSLSSMGDRNRAPTATKKKERNDAVVEVLPPKIKEEPAPSPDIAEDAVIFALNVKPPESTSSGMPLSTADVSLVSLGPLIFAPRIMAQTVGRNGIRIFRETIEVPPPLLQIQKVTARLIGIRGKQCKEWKLATGANVTVKGKNPFIADDFCNRFREGNLRVDVQAPAFEPVVKCSEMVRGFLTGIWNEACINRRFAQNRGDRVIQIQQGELGGGQTNAHAVPERNTVTVTANSTAGEGEPGTGTGESVARRMAEFADLLAAMSGTSLSDETDVASLVQGLKQTPGFPELRPSLETYVQRARAMVSSSEMLIRSSLKIKQVGDPSAPNSHFEELLAKAAARKANLDTAAELLGAGNSAGTPANQTDQTETREDSDADEDELDAERMSIFEGILARVRSDGLESLKSFVARAVRAGQREEDADRSAGSGGNLKASEVDQEDASPAKKPRL